MKTRTKIVLLAIYIFALPSFHACDADCPSRKFDTYVFAGGRWLDSGTEYLVYQGNATELFLNL